MRRAETLGMDYIVLFPIFCRTGSQGLCVPEPSLGRNCYSTLLYMLRCEACRATDTASPHGKQRPDRLTRRQPGHRSKLGQASLCFTPHDL